MYVVFDVETTGLDFKKDKIIEISAVELDQYFNKTREFNKVIKQDVRLSREIVELTGITQQEMRNGEPEEKVLPEFLEFVGHQILVGHNVGFDLSMLYATVGVLGFDFFDTLSMALVLCRWMTKHKLNLVCDEFNVDLTNHHRSLYDSRATAEVFAYLKAMADARGFDFKNVIASRKRDGEKEVEFPYVHLAYPLEAPKIFTRLGA